MKKLVLLCSFGLLGSFAMASSDVVSEDDAKVCYKTTTTTTTKPDGTTTTTTTTTPVPCPVTVVVIG